VHEEIRTASAPEPIGPYSQAVRAGDVIFASGQIPLDPTTGQLVGADNPRAAAERVIENLKSVLEAGGASLEDVVKVTVYLSNLDHFAAVNEVYARHFGGSRPARACVECSRLPKSALVEMDAVALVGA
jgi:2-iminobutanoate/2-iminopropanoate deaminase